MTDRYREGIEAMREAAAKVAEQAGEPYSLNTATGAMMFRAVTDKIATAIRALPLPSTPDDGKAEVVAVKLLAWRDHRPDSFPEPAWSAETPFGFYHIEEVCASDGPAYVVRLHAHHFIADKDGLNEAKEAAQFDYEQRIRSALVRPSPASDCAIREALALAVSALDHVGLTYPDCPFIERVLTEINALSAHAGDAAKESGGGVEGHAAVPPEIPTQRSGESRDPLGDGSVKVGPHREDAAGIKPGPPDQSRIVGTAGNFAIDDRLSLIPREYLTDAESKSLNEFESLNEVESLPSPPDTHAEVNNG